MLDKNSIAAFARKVQSLRDQLSRDMDPATAALVAKSMREIGEALDRFRQNPEIRKMAEDLQRFREASSLLQQQPQRPPVKKKLKTRPRHKYPHLDEAMAKLEAEGQTVTAKRLMRILKDDFGVFVPEEEQRTIERRIREARKARQNSNR